jgi:hypothetical protein
MTILLSMTVTAEALARCSSSITFGQQGQACMEGTAPCFLISPGYNLPGTVLGHYWALGYGDPAFGVGIDNGAWDRSEWLNPKLAGLKIKGDWLDSASIDGCIDGASAPGTTNEVMVVSLSDSDVFSHFGYFAVAAVGRGLPSDLRQFDFAAGVAEDIVMAPIPAPRVMWSWRQGCTQMFEIESPSLTKLEAGFYSDGSVELDDVIVGYRLYEKFPYEHGSGPLWNRRRSEWTPASDVIPLGDHVILEYSCMDYFIDIAYLALSVVFDSGFESEYVSHNSRPLVLWADCAYDMDGDGFCDWMDCDDFNHRLYPGSVEFNNGTNDSCSNTWVDEVEGMIGFYYPDDKTKLSWLVQPGATLYEVLRSEVPDFALGCTTATSTIGHWQDPEVPLLPGDIFHYLVRALEQYTGSLGAGSSGVERTTACP